MTCFYTLKSSFFQSSSLRPLLRQRFFSWGAVVSSAMCVTLISASLVGVLLLQPSGWAKASKQSSWPVRNFLPPVATINPKIEPNPSTQETLNTEALDVVSLPAVTSPILGTRPRLEAVNQSLNIRETDPVLKALTTQQHSVEEADLKKLWDATVERNPVIRFSLEKLSSPEEVHPQQSSVFMRKTLSMLISGATLATTMLPGGGGYRNLGMMAGGDAVRNLTLGTPHSMENRLSPTEKIQLAGLIDDLQRQVLQSYQQYRLTLNSLADAHQKTLGYNQGYTEALSHSEAVLQSDKHNVSVNRVLLLMSSGAAYHKAQLHEEELRHKAMELRVKLERMAGNETVKALALTVGSEQLMTTTTTTTTTHVPTSPSAKEASTQQGGPL